MVVYITHHTLPHSCNDPLALICVRLIFGTNSRHAPTFRPQPCLCQVSSVTCAPGPPCQYSSFLARLPWLGCRHTAHGALFFAPIFTEGFTGLGRAGAAAHVHKFMGMTDMHVQMLMLCTVMSFVLW